MEGGQVGVCRRACQWGVGAGVRVTKLGMGRGQGWGWGGVEVGGWVPPIRPYDL